MFSRLIQLSLATLQCRGAKIFYLFCCCFKSVVFIIFFYLKSASSGTTISLFINIT